MTSSHFRLRNRTVSQPSAGIDDVPLTNEGPDKRHLYELLSNSAHRTSPTRQCITELALTSALTVTGVITWRQSLSMKIEGKVVPVFHNLEQEPLIKSLGPNNAINVQHCQRHCGVHSAFRSSSKPNAQCHAKLRQAAVKNQPVIFSNVTAETSPYINTMLDGNSKGNYNAFGLTSLRDGSKMVKRLPLMAKSTHDSGPQGSVPFSEGWAVELLSFFKSWLVERMGSLLFHPSAKLLSFIFYFRLISPFIVSLFGWGRNVKKDFF